MRLALVYFNGEKNIGRGAGYIASSILDMGYDLDFYDTFYTTTDQIIEKCGVKNYSVVMISASTLFFKDVVGFCKEIKQIRANTIILLGGAHATIIGGRILEEYLDIDYICVGEGEGFVKEFLQQLGKTTFYDIPNLGYRSESGVVINPIRNPTDLDTLPNFRWDLFPEKSILLKYPIPNFCYVFATRGCPYSCSYCCNSFYLKLYRENFLRKRNISDLIKELKQVKNKYPVGIFYFGDEMILFDMDYVTELFQTYKREIGLPYGCMARVENIDESVIELFRDTGCKYVGMGVECGDENFRRTMLKRYMTNDQIIKAFDLVKSIPGIMTTSYNMIGYPTTNDNELTEATIELNSIIKPNIVQVSLFYPFPGTWLHDYCQTNDLIDCDIANNITDYFSQSVLKLGLTKEQFSLAVQEVQRRVNAT